MTITRLLRNVVPLTALVAALASFQQSARSATATPQDSPELKRTITGHYSFVTSVAFSPDGKTLASGSNDKTVKLWDAQTGKLMRTLTGHIRGVSSVAFSPDGKMLASGGAKKTLLLWEAATGKLTRTLTDHLGDVVSVKFSPDGQTLASVSRAFGKGVTHLYDDVRLWDAQTGTLKRTLAGPAFSVNSIAFSPDGKTLASVGGNIVLLWDAQTGKIRRTMNSNQVWSVAFSPDGKTIASSGEDKTVQLWDALTGKLKRTLTANIRGASSAFSPDGKMVAIADGVFKRSQIYGVVQLWDAQTGKLKRTLTGHSDKVGPLAFSPDGKTIASGSEDKTVKLWDVSKVK